ncbi:DUF308 domain-containing protein [Sedimentibacter sp. zth1]|uniref:HdeD family acid-resistance protein n=1 Tax=Sedimentibacter sp. zth1 TaxID=2816908 RepID=UPI001A92FC47|nr:DUF308 domain-containing protein [Sedimentibacter sp. zth1]QSX06918.1 DUF308 domain-containing protein [Sedimentibacter sp. zth1]
MDSVKKAKTAYVAYSIVLIALGILLIFLTEATELTLCYIVGLITLICGIIKFISYFVNDTYGLAFQFDFALGIFTMLIGLVLILHPKNILVFLNVVIGIFVIIDGTFKLQTAKEARQFGLDNWWLILILAIITAIVGLLLIFNPFEGVLALSVIIGIALIADGIENLCVAIYTIKLVKRFLPSKPNFTEK